MVCVVVVFECRAGMPQRMQPHRGLLMSMSRLCSCSVYMSPYFGINDAKLRIGPCACPCSHTAHIRRSPAPS